MNEESGKVLIMGEISAYRAASIVPVCYIYISSAVHLYIQHGRAEHEVYARQPKVWQRKPIRCKTLYVQEEKHEEKRGILLGKGFLMLYICARNL